MDLSSLYTIYTPGEGYSAYVPGRDTPVMSWGKEFWAMVKEQAGQNAANGTERDPSPNEPGLYNPKALESFARRELTRDELRELAAKLLEKYDPTSMTQEEFDSFMDDLVKEGVLSRYELGVLGYHGFTVHGAMDDIRGVFSTRADTGNPNWDTYFGRYGHAHTLRETGGNALAYVMLKLLWNKDPSGSDQFVKRIETQNSAFQAMADVLDAMRRRQ